MGNCHKTRLCQCLHNSHCHLFSLLSRYASFFNFGRATVGEEEQTYGVRSLSDNEDDEEEKGGELKRRKCPIAEHNSLDSTKSASSSALAFACQPKSSIASALVASATDSGAAIFAPLSAIAAAAAKEASGSAGVVTRNYCDLHQIYSETRTRTFRHYHHYHPNNIRPPPPPQVSGSQTTLHSLKSSLTAGSSTADLLLLSRKVPINRQRSASHCPKAGSPLVAAKGSAAATAAAANLAVNKSATSAAAAVASSSRSDVEVPGYKPSSGCINSKCYCHQPVAPALSTPPSKVLGPTGGGGERLNSSLKPATRDIASDREGVAAEISTPTSTNSSISAGSSVTLTLAQQEQQAKRASSLRTLNKRFGYPADVANPTALPPGKGNGHTKKKHPSPQHESLRLTSSIAVMSATSSSTSKNSAGGGAGGGAFDQIYNPNTNYYMPASNQNFKVIDHQLNGPGSASVSGAKRTGSGKGSRAKPKLLKLNDLNNECLLAIMNHLTLQERLNCERVCRRWQHVIRLSLQAPASLKIGEHSVKCHCTCSHYPSWDLAPSAKFKRDEAGYIIYPHSIVCYLLTICKNMRCLNFSHCYLDDQTLQIIMSHSDMIECLHLYDIRLEADSTEDLDVKLNNGHHNEPSESLSSAVSAFATEQLAVFGGLMRRLSTRKPSGGAGLAAVKSRMDAKEKDRLLSENGTSSTKSKAKPCVSPKSKSKKEIAGTDSKRSSNLSLAMSGGEPSRKTTPSSIEMSSNAVATRMATTPTGSSAPPLSGISASERRATQRRREWSRHRSDVRALHTEAVPDASEDQLSVNETSMTGGKSQEDSDHSGGGSRGRTLSPSLAPNLANLVADFSAKLDLHDRGEASDVDDLNDFEDESEFIEMESTIVEEEYDRMIRNRARQQHEQFNGGAHSQSSSHPKPGGSGSTNPNSIAGRLNDIQAFVAMEQVKTEYRQTHLLQWKSFVKKLGAQLTSLSIGALNSVDQIVIDILMKYCEVLVELRINNEIDILSYMTYLKDSVRRIHISSEHGVGIEVVSMLAFRNYAEKVIHLGRITVRPEHIDSVISTIGSNFINLRSLQLRLEEHDIDVATPASLLFHNLRELNLQFGNGNVDRPFKKILHLGWASVRSLTLQYGSFTEEAVRAIGTNMPQLRKLMLHAVEFRCDHSGRRYGHRICTNCSHAVWKAIATLPHLTHLRLHRVIIDEEICKSLYRMSRLQTLELHYCQNVNDNVVGVCAELAKRNQRRSFTLDIISRNFIHFQQPPMRNLTIDVKVVGR